MVTISFPNVTKIPRSISLGLNPHCALQPPVTQTEQKRQGHKNGKAHFKKEIIQHKTGRRTLT